MGSLIIKTILGAITLTLEQHSAPLTVQHLTSASQAGTFNDVQFYRPETWLSEFVIQMGTHLGTGHHSPNIPENEVLTTRCRSNVRGTAAFAHGDVPNASAGVFFINTQDNSHMLDEACVHIYRPRN
jgi:cyclophilin family peptidyl-prolyl cis-trans isomerase